MLLPPPPLPLFPYTTLFRSRPESPRPVARLRLLVGHARGRALPREHPAATLVVHDRDARDPVRRADVRDPRAAGDSVERDQDRKSTRLNSSHRCISYAVFCLNVTTAPSSPSLSLHDALPI